MINMVLAGSLLIYCCFQAFASFLYLHILKFMGFCNWTDLKVLLALEVAAGDGELLPILLEHQWSIQLNASHLINSLSNMKDLPDNFYEIREILHRFNA